MVPARGQLPAAERLALFTKMATAASAEVQLVDAGEIAGVIAQYLAERQLPATLKTGSDARLAQIDWTGSALGVEAGEASADDTATLSHAEVGVAETGSLLLVSGAENPTLLNFLPLAHIVLVKEQDLENTRAAFRSNIENGSLEPALAIFASLERFWSAHGCPEDFAGWTARS